MEKQFKEYVELIGLRATDTKGAVLARSECNEDHNKTMWQNRLDSLLESDKRFTAIYDADSYCVFQPALFSHFIVNTYTIPE